ncbi:MAG: prolyl oligopeptidase family serine peptidase [Xanthomonadales bacterium]|nr:prolyl oligopeptidase family serine peptidase [Xanthomonadales bacterium]
MLAVIDETSGDCSWLLERDVDVREARWSPDRSQLAWVQDSPGTQRHRMQLWLQGSDGGMRRLAPELVSISDLTWSPDCRYIAVAGNTVEGASQSFPYLVDVGSGEPGRLHGIELAIPACLHWRAEDSLLLLQALSGDQRIVRVAVDDGSVTPVLARDHEQVLSFAAGPAGLACVLAGAVTGPHLIVCDERGEGSRNQGKFNAWQQQRPTVNVQRRQFDVPDGQGGRETIDGWLLLPEGEGPFPLLLDMHGGPHSHVIFELGSHVHWPVLVGQGWAVLALNTVGSDSYGEAFADRLRGRWGELDLPQYAVAVQSLREEGIAGDTAVFGHSYGGFLAAWALAEQMLVVAGVISAGVLDQRSHTGTSDTGWYVGPYAMVGQPHEVPQTYARLSPVRRAHRFQAPTLILQGEDDLRCPKGQAQQLFSALVGAGKTPTRLVLFPGGNHHVATTGRPSHRETWYGQLVDWLQAHRSRPG